MLVALSILATGVLAPGAVSHSSGAGPLSVADIPGPYLAAYRNAAARFGLGSYGWSYLAGIGKIDSDHGRSHAPGVHSGENSYECCAGPMQIDNGGGSGGGTWGAYKVDARPRSPRAPVSERRRRYAATGQPERDSAAKFHAGTRRYGT